MKNDPPRGKIYDSIVDTIGATPLVRARRIAADLPAKVNILLKLEFFNPLASVKDRIAAAMIEAMEEAGLIRKIRRLSSRRRAIPGSASPSSARRRDIT